MATYIVASIICRLQLCYFMRCLFFDVSTHKLSTTYLILSLAIQFYSAASACYYLISFSPQSPPRRRHNNHRKWDRPSGTTCHKVTASWSTWCYKFMEQFYRLVPVERCDLYSSTSKDKQVRPQKPKHRRCLTPHVGNFGYLRFINLVDNNFRGEIPEKVGRLFRLEYLLLANNHFSGKIPANLSHCSNLVKFYAHGNNL